MIPIRTEINPRGVTAEDKLNDLVRQLRRQNEELVACLQDLQRQITEGRK